MALNQAVTDAASMITSSINSGQTSARASVGGGGVAFGWTGGLLPTLANYVQTATAAGMTYSATLVAESGTPAAIVTPGSAKPLVTAISTQTVALSKFAGYGEANLEDFLNAQDLGAAIASVLGQSCLRAFETAAVAKLDAADTTPVTGADWVAAVAAAQAEILSKGGSPSVLVISAADYGDFVGDVVDRLVPSAESPVGSVLGTPVHVSAGAPTGKAYVVDGSAVLAVQHEKSPLLLLDVASQSINNKARLVGDLVASVFVLNAALVVEITKPVLMARSSESTKGGHHK